MATAAEGESKTYGAVQIVEVKYYRDEDAYRFGIEWDPKDVKEGDENITFEPLDNLLDCPTLVLNYDKLMHRDWKTKNPNSDFRIKPLRIAARKRAPEKKVHFEYIPQGNEFLKKIYTCWVDKNSEFYFVSFHGRREKEIVRRPFLEYYYPVDLIIFKINCEKKKKKPE